MPSYHHPPSSFSHYEKRSGHSSNKSLPSLPNIAPDARTPILYNNGFNYSNQPQEPLPKRNTIPKSVQDQKNRLAEELRVAAEIERQRIKLLYSEPSIRYIGPSIIPDDYEIPPISPRLSNYSPKLSSSSPRLGGGASPKLPLYIQKKHLRKQQDLLNRAQLDLYNNHSFSAAANHHHFTPPYQHHILHHHHNYPLQQPEKDFVVEEVARAIWPIVDQDPDLNTTSHWSDDSEDEEECKISHKRNSTKLFDSWKGRRHSNKKVIAASTQEQIVNSFSWLQ